MHIHTICRGKLIVLLILLLAAYINIFPQVKINEKVEINPGTHPVLLGQQNSGKYARGYTPCGPYIENTQDDNYWQVVWAAYWGPIDPDQQLFAAQHNVYFGNFVNPSNGPFEVQIIEGANYCNFEKRVDGVDEFGNNFSYMEDLNSTTISDVSGLDLIGWGDTLMVLNCVPRHPEQSYQIFYHYLTQDEATVTYSIYSAALNQTKYFHTLIRKRQFVFPEQDEPMEIPHGEETEFRLQPVPVFCSGLDTSSYYENYYCNGIFNFFAGGGFPDIVKFNVSITEGAEYGTLFYFEGDDNNRIEDNSFSNLGENTYNALRYYAKGDEPEDTGKVKIHVSTTDPEMPEADVIINIIPNKDYPIRVTFIPAKLSPGDTADIFLEKRYNDYPFSDPGNVIYESFPSLQSFNVKIEKGSKYGTILNSEGGDTSNEFNDIMQGFKFIASDSIDVDTADINIRVSTTVDLGISAAKSKHSGTKGLNKNNSLKSLEKLDKQKSKSTIKTRIKYEAQKINKIDKEKTHVIVPNATAPPSSVGTPIFGIGHTKVARGAIEIMLGETKYFGVKEKDNKYKIEEIPTKFGNEPKFPADSGGWVWQKTDMWGSNPIQKVGSKSGVYWEKRWYKSTDNTDVAFSDSGMIRLIGRFWENGKEDSFKVKLKTIHNDSLEIKVTKPGKLLSDGQSKSYSLTKDVHDSTYSIDSICIHFGGKYGIPPQMIKGQMFTESATKNFGGNIGWGFAPSYRYEAYTVQFWDIVKNIVKADTNPFIVTNDAMGKLGSVGVPDSSEHMHVLFHHYFTTPQTVWDIIEANSSLVDVNNKITTYGFQYKGTSPDTLRKYQLKSGTYSIVNDTYKDYLKGKKVNGKRSGGYEDFVKEKYGLKVNEKLSKEQQTEANDSARIATINYLKNDYEGVIAQTRIASSYGLLQSLYTTVLDEHNYPTSDSSRPENLNEVKIGMDYALKHLNKLFKNSNTFSLETNNNWVSNYAGNLSSKKSKFPKPDAGFEQALSVMYYMWNSGLNDGTYAVYHKKVLNNSKKFLPRSK